MANKQKRKRRFGLGGGRHAAKRKKSNGHGGRHKKTIPTGKLLVQVKLS